MGDAGRIAPLRAPDDLGAEPVGPHRELLDGCRPEGVAGPENDALPFAGEDPRELRDRRRLSRSVDAGDQDHGRPGGGHGDSRLGVPQAGEELGADRVEDDLGIDDPGPKALADVGDDRLRGGRAHVGADEDPPQLLEEVLVDEPPLPLEEVADVGPQHLGRLCQPGLEAVKEAARLLGAVGGAGRRRCRRGVLARLVPARLLLRILAAEAENAHRSSPWSSVVGRIRRSAGIRLRPGRR